jgi:hypothetical protein
MGIFITSENIAQANAIYEIVRHYDVKVGITSLDSGVWLTVSGEQAVLEAISKELNTELAMLTFGMVDPSIEYPVGLKEIKYN